MRDPNEPSKIIFQQLTDTYQAGEELENVTLSIHSETAPLTDEDVPLSCLSLVLESQTYSCSRFVDDLFYFDKISLPQICGKYSFEANLHKSGFSLSSTCSFVIVPSMSFFFSYHFLIIFIY